MVENEVVGEGDQEIKEEEGEDQETGEAVNYRLLRNLSWKQ